MNIIDKIEQESLKEVPLFKVGDTVSVHYKIKEGEIYYVRIPIKIESNIESQKIPLNIIFEDTDILVINKPAGMVTHPAPGNQNYTLVNALLYHTKKKLSSVNSSNRPGIIHRLDKDTSGLIVVAKNNYR